MVPSIEAHIKQTKELTDKLAVTGTAIVEGSGGNAPGKFAWKVSNAHDSSGSPRYSYIELC